MLLEKVNLFKRPIRTRVISLWFQPQERETKHNRPKRAEQTTKKVGYNHHLVLFSE